MVMAATSNDYLTHNFFNEGIIFPTKYILSRFFFQKKELIQNRENNGNTFIYIFFIDIPPKEQSFSSIFAIFKGPKLYLDKQLVNVPCSI